ncbi:MAG: AAA family ATPase [Eubacterium sp.]|nr:AAA family ATPase [Eubacterium sp.]
MERNVMADLVKWKNKKKRKPLMLLGVRQCGKTFIAKKFGEEQFENVAYFNFEGNAALDSVFGYNFDVKRIVDELELAASNEKIVPGKTLLIFDEIQASPNAITSLKYFCEDMPELHVIAAGSLLGVSLKREGLSFPVGKIERINMYPMSFKEFVEANGDAKLLEGLEKMDRTREIPLLYTEPLKKHLLNYYIIGGMPAVVETWINTHSYDEVEKVQADIIEDYENDFAKYAPIKEIAKIRQIWHSIPEQLARENNKFIFSHVKEGGRSRELEDALEWLIDAGLVYKQKLVEKPEIPLSYMADDTSFKVFMSDVGLLRYKAGVYYGTILEGDERYVRFKGALAENYVLTELIKADLSCYYWRSGNQAEVDFLTEDKGYMIPIEVKSADNTHAKSFSSFVTRYKPKYGFKASLKNIGDNKVKETMVYSLPLYMLWKIKEYIK